MPEFLYDLPPPFGVEPLPIFVVNSSRYISRLANYQKTLFDLLDTGDGLERHRIKESLIPQIKAFYHYLDNI